MPSSSSLDRLFASAAGASAGASAGAGAGAGASAASSPDANSLAADSSSSSSTSYDPHQPGAIALAGGYTKLPSGIVLDASGKPCKQCTSGSAWRDLMRKTTTTTSTSSRSTPATGNSIITSTAGAAGAAAAAAAAAAATTTPAWSSPDSEPAADCPPDVEELGRSSWTLLHSIAGSYPAQAPPSMQATMRSFISTFSQLYPCGTCAEDFRSWLRQPGNEPRVGGQDELGEWTCQAHNAVNVKIGKPVFDCSLWKQRWRDGWADGRCD